MTHISFSMFLLCSNAELQYESNLQDPEYFHLTKCDPKGRFAILLHGWRESCETQWMKQLIESMSIIISEQVSLKKKNIFYRNWPTSRRLYHMHGLRPIRFRKLCTISSNIWTNCANSDTEAASFGLRGLRYEQWLSIWIQLWWTIGNGSWSSYWIQATERNR